MRETKLKKRLKVICKKTETEKNTDNTDKVLDSSCFSTDLMDSRRK